MWRSRPAAAVPALAVAAALGAAAAPAHAAVFLGARDALAWAFPRADAIDRETFLLDDAERAALERWGGGAHPSRLATLHTARRDGAVLGYAVIDVHNVRSQSEALLIALSPEGRVERLRVLAFYEPPEYLPPERWLEQFPGAAPGARLRVGRDIHGIAGSTLTAQAVAGSVRRALALYRLQMERGESSGGDDRGVAEDDSLDSGSQHSPTGGGTPRRGDGPEPLPEPRQPTGGGP